MFSKFLYEDQIFWDIKAKNSYECFLEMLRYLENSKKIKDKSPILTALMTRKELESTSIGYNIAFPHARTFQLENPMLIIGKSKNGIDFYSRYVQKVNFVFMLLFPRTLNEVYLELVGGITRFLNSSYLRNCLWEIKTAKELINLIRELEGRINNGLTN